MYIRDNLHHKRANLRLSWLFLLLAYHFIFSFSSDVVGVEDELELAIEGIKLSESFLKNGRIEISSRLEIIDYDKSDVQTGSYLMDQDFIWIFKDRKWRIEQQMKDSNGNEYYNIQVFNGEKKMNYNVDLKMATISADTRYVNPPHTRAFGSPPEYMFRLFSDLGSEDLEKCKQIKFIDNKRLDGIDCRVIKFVCDDEGDETEGLLWVAPSRGYRVMKSDVHGQSYQVIREFKSLREWSPGIWLPTKGNYTLNFITDGIASPQVKVNFSVNRVELEQAIRDDSFQLEFAPGTSVYNATTGSVSRIPGASKQ